ncbi:NADPH-dependent FMN reductase [Paenibacillus agricola]|uniref:NAD(P)H-dependent oxidoreductase n=1 Tax=Paenibacillus agricola TaxID=2716264 RepID=A0ABX0J4N0_9BACL|nr:NADPH-dependent FMN reductase [Paenibacillus agricola]NHN31265.1 NAD(P)H-dependent oxidoreductase [Paenibacillus agricola]
MTKITIISGSNRAQATTTQLCSYLQQVLESKGCLVTLLDLYVMPLPLYSPDVVCEDANLAILRNSLNEADGIILATPEYHGAPSGVLKNALDFVGSAQFSGKVVLSVSSTGGPVGVSSLQQLQTIVRSVHGINCPEWISIGGENRTFTPEGEPVNEKLRERALHTLQYFVKMVEAFSPEL